MALVSYVDILEVVSELRDFKATLVEGEKISQIGGITDLSVKVQENGVIDIGALCQPAEAKHTPHSISISIVSKPRLLECKCSCLNGKIGRCQHVVAALMHIHRNNVTAETACTDSEQDQRDGKEAEHAVGRLNTIIQDNSTKVISFPSSADAVFQHAAVIVEAGRKEHRQSQLEESDIDPLLVKQEATVEMEVDSNLLEAISKLKKNAVQVYTAESQHRSKEGDLISEKRLGRGHRRAVPNPKYISDLKQYICAICTKTFGKKNHFEAHLRSHTGEKPFVCHACGQAYSQKRTLVKHKESCGKSQASALLRCQICQCVYKNQLELDAHVASHPPVNEFQCPNCNKSFVKKEGLKRHQRTHSQVSAKSDDGIEIDKNEKIKCNEKVIELTKHKQTHAHTKSFKCSECGKCFSRERTFKMHKHTQQDNASSNSQAAKKRTAIKCETCGKEFTNRVHHEEHVRSHTGERPFQCVECGKGFATKRSLRNHSHDGKNSRNRPHPCSQCSASFASSFMLKVHEKSHSDERPFTCDECGKSYRSQYVYQDHLNQHKGVKAHTCKECGKSFTWRTSLWAHTANHAKKKPFECVQCGTMFAEQSELKDHWEVHVDDKPHQCPECGLGFMLEIDCSKHIEIHKNSPSYSCTKCEEKFLWADELNRHMHTHKEKKKFLCPTCGQTFANKGHLKVHLMIHTGEKPFECETCHKRFYTRSLLRKHTVFHSNERPFECALCGDKFPTQGILRAHIRTHTGEKPFSCAQCDKAFPQSSYLKRHMLTHSKDRPFPCLHCDNSFVTKYDLKVHVRTHTGDKPYSCNECNEQFYERSQLTSHLRSHSGERPFICDLCGKGFNSSNHIKKHFGRVHPGVAPFYCLDCGERFVMYEALRKHRKTSHLPESDLRSKLEQSDCPKEETRDNPRSKEIRDSLNRLIEDSQILLEETSNTPIDVTVNRVASGMIPREYEIVQVNLVDSTELIALPEGYSCETVEVYHAESLAGFEGNEGLQTIGITPLLGQVEAVAQDGSGSTTAVKS